MLDAWVPFGFKMPGGLTARKPLTEGSDWQIWDTQEGTRALVVRESLHARWLADRLVQLGWFQPFNFGAETFLVIPSGPSHALARLSDCRSPDSKQEGIAFAEAMRASREAESKVSFHDAIYVERISRLLPTYTLTPPVPDDVVLGTWLTGGVAVSISATRRIRSLTSWLGTPDLRDVVSAAGLTTESERATPSGSSPANGRKAVFELPGRPTLQSFFREHVIEIVENAERYRALGIDFPSAIVLHGPPGCGKTFAVERLIEHLGWPSFNIDSSSVASPYIHDTPRKVAEVFESAIRNAPSVVVIDEMEAFLTDRDVGAASGQHHVEEVAEFLRRIPEATRNHVLVIAMTNRLEMIDPAILRRGRFDHIIEVGPPSSDEVQSLLDKLLGELPISGDIDIGKLAACFAGRPLSDVAYLVREAARLAARDGKLAIDSASLDAAARTNPPRDRSTRMRGIGFLADSGD